MGTFPDAEFTFLSVIDPSDVNSLAVGPATTPVQSPPALPGVGEAWYEDRTERAEELLEEAVAQAEDVNAAAETAIRTGKPAREIEEFAEEAAVDHIVIGSHGRTGVSRVLLGSVAESVVRRADCPVTVVR